jgi:vancomycin resistance protein YoaR
MNSPEHRPDSGARTGTDKLLGDLFKQNAPLVDEQGLHERVAERGRAKRRGRRRARRTRVAAVACAAVVALAAVAYGAYGAVSHFQTKPVLVLTDSTTAAATASTSQDGDAPEVQANLKLLTSGPVTLTAGGKTYPLTVEEISAALDYTPLYGAHFPSVPHLSADKLAGLFAQVAPAVEVAAVDAGFAFDGSGVQVVPGKDGTVIDKARTANALTQAALKTTGRTAAVVTMTREPDLTTAEAENLGLKDTLATYATAYNCDYPRKDNVELAAKYAGGVLLAPGEQYDFDKQIGPRTVARGWKLAPGITGPGTVEDDLGGGITQVATTLFNAAFEAGLEITERHNHSLFISHYPKGRDAVVTGGGKDLRFVNDTGHYIFVAGTSDGVTTRFSIFGTSDGRKVETTVGDFYDLKPMTKTTVTDSRLKTSETRLESNGQTGKALKVTRVVTRDGQVIHDDVFVSLWLMYPEVIAVGTGR